MRCRLSGGSAVATVEHAASAATDALFRRHSHRVWRYCLACLRRPADAEDALQQTFLQVHRALDRGVEPESETAWLLTIARNVCRTRLDVQRRRGDAEVIEDPHVIAESALTADDADDGVSVELRAALARLPLRQRQALFLREWQECSYAEIAAALDTTEAAVEMLLFRARRALEHELGARRRLRGIAAWLPTWLRCFAPAAAKVAAGAALATGVAAVTVVGTPRHAPPARRPAATAVAPPVRFARTAPAVVRRAPMRTAPRAARAPVTRRPVQPVVAAPPTVRQTPTVAAAAPVPASAPAPAPARNAAVAAPPPAAPVQVTTTTAVVTTPPTAATTTAAVTTTASAVSPTVDAAAQQATGAVAATTTAVDTVVQGAASTVQDTASQAVGTATNLLTGGP